LRATLDHHWVTARLQHGKRSVPAWLRLAVLTCAFFLLTAPKTSLGNADEPIANSRLQLRQDFAGQLEELANWCEQQGLAEQAEQTRHWSLPTLADKHIIYRIPSAAPALRQDSTGGDSDSSGIAEWHSRFMSLRQQQAAALFGLLSDAVEQGHVATAFELIYATLREQPDHAEARRLLGHVPHNGGWYSVATKRRLEAGELRHDRFGWLPSEHVPRYEQGERFYRGRWISAEREAKLRDKIARGWRIESDHFEITTNDSLESGVALADQLEGLYNAWYQLFAAYHTTPSSLKKLVRTGKLPRRATTRHKVVYFRSREEYVLQLGKRQSGIERSLGIYLNDDRTAYFFAGEEQDPGTVLHEATHQLFQEGAAAKRRIAQRANVWIVEGIACYMESLRAGSSRSGTAFDTVGGYEVARLPGARIRLLEHNFYIQFAELVHLGGTTLRRHPQAATIYTQAAGQATFLMHHGRGRYRDALVEYLRAVYSDRAGPDTLAKLAGREYSELDLEYRQFLLGAEVSSPAERAAAASARP